MVGLRKNGSKLLRIVGNAPHATSEHHEDESPGQEKMQRRSQRLFKKPGQLLQDDKLSSEKTATQAKPTRTLRKPRQQLTPPSSTRTTNAAQSTSVAAGEGVMDLGAEEDYIRDPESESESEADKKTMSIIAGQVGSRTGYNGATTDGQYKDPDPIADDARDDDEDLPEWLAQSSSQRSDQSRKRKREATRSMPGSINTYASVTYSKKYTQGFSNDTTKSSKSLKIAKKDKKEKPVARREFHTSRAYDARSDRPSRGNTRSTFRSAATAGDEDDLAVSDHSSVLSSPPRSSDQGSVLECQTLVSDKDKDINVECAICGKQVDLLLKQEYEDEFTDGRSMTFRWQQRFCQHHRRRDAEMVWRERGYPSIDWDGFEQRMRSHRKHIRAVLMAKQNSRYRDELSEMLHRGGGMTALKSLSETAIADLERGQKRTCAGYYGSRGAKAMSDYILHELSEELRTQAASDRLVAAAGTSGGVSGFVQLVLTPELAECLVKEDMGVDADRAAAILAESAEIGELMNPELDEGIADAVIENEDD